MFNIIIISTVVWNVLLSDFCTYKVFLTVLSFFQFGSRPCFVVVVCVFVSCMLLYCCVALLLLVCCVASYEFLLVMFIVVFSGFMS